MPLFFLHNDISLMPLYRSHASRLLNSPPRPANAPSFIPASSSAITVSPFSSLYMLSTPICLLYALYHCIPPCSFDPTPKYPNNTFDHLPSVPRILCTISFYHCSSSTFVPQAAQYFASGETFSPQFLHVVTATT